ncbi:MAG: sensor histidine kinase [Nannocystaceae bacterium]|nr:ATP-binding protein [bacterium]
MCVRPRCYARDKRALERQVAASQRLESVGRFAGGIAHDFNNLLTVIQSHADYVIEAQQPGATALADVLAIREAADRAARLTAQLLAFSRRQPQELRVFDLCDVVRDTEPMLRRLLGEHVRYEYAANSEVCPVKADLSQIEQVLMNLVVNARDAMPHGGRIVVDTAVVDLDGSTARPYRVTPGRYVRLSICDDGVGMSPDVAARVFEPFFTTKAPEKGTGLGLATVYGVVKQSGGYIEVTSEEGQGTRFVLDLPLCADVRPPSRRSLRVH